MPAGTLERTSSAVAATPEKPAPGTESRKSSKPIMEKRRRARINESLSQLKTLILDALRKDSSRHSKLEKADILEMTVKHLRNLQRLNMTAVVNAEPSVLVKYRAGFTECVEEVTRFLSTCEGVNADVRTRLLGHLAARVTQINLVSLASPPAGSLGQPGAQVPAVLTLCKSSSQIHLPPDVVGGFQVVPSPDGHFAFLVPNVALAPPAPPVLTSDSVWRPW